MTKRCIGKEKTTTMQITPYKLLSILNVFDLYLVTGASAWWWKDKGVNMGKKTNEVGGESSSPKQGIRIPNLLEPPVNRAPNRVTC